MTDEKMRIAFRTAFKEMTLQYPIYGLHSTVIKSPNEWWKKLIRLSLKNSNIRPRLIKPILPTLSDNLLSRFSTNKAYSLAEGVPEIFESLTQLRNYQQSSSSSSQRGEGRVEELRWSLATNSDSRILSACQSLKLNEYLNVEVHSIENSNSLTSKERKGQDDYYPPQSNNNENNIFGPKIATEPTLSYFIGFEKPNPNFFHLAVQRAFSNSNNSHQESLSDLCAQTIYVGDHFHEDYMGARDAGLQSAWLKRSQPWPEDISQEEREQVVALESMDDLISVIKDSWTSN